MQHVIQTQHIQRLIENALSLAQTLDGKSASQHYGGADGFYELPRAAVVVQLPVDVHAAGEALPEHALCKAISDLRHAADELDAERLSCYGWKQK